MALTPGTVFAGFTIEKTLGVGGMGTVYLARHPRLPRSDALKLLRPELSYDPDFAVRFAREADIAAQLSHPNIVGVNDRGVEDGQLWISMPYIAGTDAEHALQDSHGPLPAMRAIRIVSEIAGALDFAHRNGLWHRDVKPANILLAAGDGDEPERVLLTDFGIAKAADEGRGLTRTGNVIATFDYAPPEQIEGRPVDHRADIYALGCVLYKLLTGSVPYPGTTMASALYGHLNLPPPRPTERTPWLPPGLDDVIARGMAKNPDERYPNCRALATAARQALDNFPSPPPLPYSISATRTVAGSDQRMILGPLDTEGLSSDDRSALLGLVRRSRLFDLPPELPAADPSDESGPTSEPPRSPVSASSAPSDTVTIVVQATGRTASVTYLPDASPRPPELDDVLHGLEDRLTWQPAGPSSGTGARPAAPTTVVESSVAIPIQPPVEEAARPSVAVPEMRTGEIAGAAVRAAKPPAAEPLVIEPPVVVPIAPESPAVGSVAAVSPGAEPSVPPPWLAAGPTAALRSSETSPTGGPLVVSPPIPILTGSAADGASGKQRSKLLAAAVVGLLIIFGAVTALVLTSGDGADRGDSSAGSTSADDEDDGGGEASAGPVDLGIPAGDPLPDDVLVANHEVDGNIDLFAVDSQNGVTLQRLTTAAEAEFGPVISPDRSSVIFLSQQGTAQQLWVVGSDGAAARPLFPAVPAGCEGVRRPAWNPADPTMIAVVCLDAASTATLQLLTLDGQSIRTLDPGVPNFDDLAFSPDGQSLVYWGSDNLGAADGNLYALSVDGSAPATQLTDETLSGSADPIWSPDGTQIAFRTQVDGGTDIFVIAADGTNPVPLSPEVGVDQDPAWSPDGASIAFKSNRDDGSGSTVDRLWIMNNDGSNPRRVSVEDIADGFAPAWSTR